MKRCKIPITVTEIQDRIRGFKSEKESSGVYGLAYELCFYIPDFCGCPLVDICKYSKQNSRVLILQVEEQWICWKRTQTRKNQVETFKSITLLIADLKCLARVLAKM